MGVTMRKKEKLTNTTPKVLADQPQKAMKPTSSKHALDSTEKTPMNKLKSEKTPIKEGSGWAAAKTAQKNKVQAGAVIAAMGADPKKKSARGRAPSEDEQGEKSQPLRPSAMDRIPTDRSRDPSRERDGEEQSADSDTAATGSASLSSLIIPKSKKKNKIDKDTPKSAQVLSAMGSRPNEDLGMKQTTSETPTKGLAPGKNMKKTVSREPSREPAKSPRATTNKQASNEADLVSPDDETLSVQDAAKATAVLALLSPTGKGVDVRNSTASMSSVKSDLVRTKLKGIKKSRSPSPRPKDSDDKPEGYPV